MIWQFGTIISLVPSCSDCLGLRIFTSGIPGGSTEEWKLMFDTNVIGLCICTREAVQDMLSNKIDGHVVHINSIAGHKVTIHDPPSASVYPASKHAVTALTESLRQEMAWLKNKIKITVSIFQGAYLVLFIHFF